ATDPLRYQTPGKPAGAHGRELATVKIRYKAPEGEKSQLLSRVISAGDSPSALNQASDDFRFASAVAAFGMLLRDSPNKGAASWSKVATLAQGALGDDREGYRKEFLALVARAEKLKPERAMSTLEGAAPALRSSPSPSPRLETVPGFSVIL